MREGRIFLKFVRERVRSLLRRSETGVGFHSVMHMKKYEPMVAFSIVVCVIALQNSVHLTKFGDVNFYPI